MLTGGMGTEGETGHMDKTQSNLSSEAEAGGIRNSRGDSNGMASILRVADRPGVSVMSTLPPFPSASTSILSLSPSDPTA